MHVTGPETAFERVRDRCSCWVDGRRHLTRPGPDVGRAQRGRCRRSAEWRQDRDAGGWQGRVVYAVDDGRATVMVEAWVHARHLLPAGD
jgi:hypothetical protein